MMRTAADGCLESCNTFFDCPVGSSSAEDVEAVACLLSRQTCLTKLALQIGLLSRHQQWNEIPMSRIILPLQSLSQLQSLLVHCRRAGPLQRETMAGLLDACPDMQSWDIKSYYEPGNADQVGGHR
jgi:hypothetical protein